MRFYVMEIAGGKVDVCDYEFGYDALLSLSGDFGTYAERMAYAKAVADALNKGDIPKPPASPTDEGS